MVTFMVGVIVAVMVMVTLMVVMVGVIVAVVAVCLVVAMACRHRDVAVAQFVRHARRSNGGTHIPVAFEGAAHEHVQPMGFRVHDDREGNVDVAPQVDFVGIGDVVDDEIAGLKAVSSCPWSWDSPAQIACEARRVNVPKKSAMRFFMVAIPAQKYS